MFTMAWPLQNPSEEDEAMKLMRLIVMIAAPFAGTLLMAAQCKGDVQFYWPTCPDAFNL
jgi:hypothetical protein